MRHNCHDMTLAVKVVLNPNTTNNPILIAINFSEYQVHVSITAKILLTLTMLEPNKLAFADSANQDQTAQYMQSNL